MFDIGFWELLVIGVMALLVLGPERLPGAIKSTISTVRSIKQVANGFKQEVANQFDAHELHTNLKKAEELGMQSIGKELQDSVDELKAAAESVQRPYQHNGPKEALQAQSELPLEEELEPKVANKPEAIPSVQQSTQNTADKRSNDE